MVVLRFVVVVVLFSAATQHFFELVAERNVCLLRPTTHSQQERCYSLLNNRCTMQCRYKCIKSSHFNVTTLFCVSLWLFLLFCSVCWCLCWLAGAVLYVCTIFTACGTRVRVLHSCTQLLLAVFYKLDLFRLIENQQNKTYLLRIDLSNIYIYVYCIYECWAKQWRETVF